MIKGFYVYYNNEIALMVFVRLFSATSSRGNEFSSLRSTDRKDFERSVNKKRVINVMLSLFISAIKIPNLIIGTMFFTLG